MSFFTHPDFFAIEQVDLQSKLIQPSLQLYNQTLEQLKTSYDDAVTMVLDTHLSIAASTKQIYERPPMDTLTEWASVLQNSGNDFITLVKTDVLPKADGYYQQLVVSLVETSDKVKPVLQETWNNPKQALDFVSAATVNVFSQIKNVTTQNAEALMDLGNVFVIQPVETAQALYRNVLSATVDTYFDLVSSLLITF
jgi:hypothetical protein